jgi:SAM-dependent methyltransferase
MNAVEYKNKIYSNYKKFDLSTIDLSKTLRNTHDNYKKTYGNLLPKDKESTILDLGCGHGAFVYFLNKEGYKNVTGIELSPGRVETAREVGLLNVEHGDIFTYLKDNKNPIDVILMINIIEHFPKGVILQALRLAYNALKNGGLIVMQVPNAMSPFFGRTFYSDFTHEVAFTPVSIKHILEESGFREVDCYSLEPRINGIRSALKYFFWKTINFAFQAYINSEGPFEKEKYIFSQSMIVTCQK